MHESIRAFACISLILAPITFTGISAAGAAAAAPPRVDVLIGPRAPDLEQHAAQQLCHYLQELFGVTAVPAHEPSADAQISLIVGQPTTNPAVVRGLAGRNGRRSASRGSCCSPSSWTANRR